MNKKSSLILEFIALFVLLPTAILSLHLYKFFLIVLWVFAGFCYLYLRKDKSFDQDIFLRKKAVTRSVLKKIILIFLMASIPITAYTYIYENARFLKFMMQSPQVWAMVMVLYPLLSVYPQEIIYRAFLFHRYKTLFNSDLKILIASALAFGYAHIIFNNFIAVSMCILGGFIFGLTYQKHKSLLLVAMEHALYGCMIFTVGLGWYFYHGFN